MRWESNPPEHLVKWGKEYIEPELHRLAEDIFQKTLSFDKADVDVHYKNIAPESLLDSSFLEELKKTMNKKHVPQAIIDSLFERGQAAPAADSFRGEKG